MALPRWLFAGLTTAVCVGLTARQTADRGFRVVMVSDACTERSQEMHEAALMSFSHVFGQVRSAQELTHFLASANSASAAAEPVSRAAALLVKEFLWLIAAHPGFQACTRRWRQQRSIAFRKSGKFSKQARTSGVAERPRWPMIVLRSPPFTSVNRRCSFLLSTDMIFVQQFLEKDLAAVFPTAGANARKSPDLGDCDRHDPVAE
jgi:hypothetical protein